MNTNKKNTAEIQKKNPVKKPSHVNRTILESKQRVLV